MDKVVTLQTLEVFSELEEEDLEQLAHIVIEKEVPAGQVLFVEEMKGETLFVVLDGVVQVSRKLADGSDIALYRAEAGDFLGAFSLFQPGERAVSAKTLEPSTLLIIRRKDLISLAEKAPHAAFRFALELAGTSLQKLQALSESQVEEIERLKDQL